MQAVEHQYAQFKFHALSDRQPVQNVPYCPEMLLYIRSRTKSRAAGVLDINRPVFCDFFGSLR